MTSHLDNIGTCKNCSQWVHARASDGRCPSCNSVLRDSLSLPPSAIKSLLPHILSDQVVAPHDPSQSVLSLRSLIGTIGLTAAVFALFQILIKLASPFVIGDPPLRALYDEGPWGEIAYLKASANWHKSAGYLDLVGMIPAAITFGLSVWQVKSRRLMKRFEEPTAISVLSTDFRPPILYLRSFSEDRRKSLLAAMGTKTAQQRMALALSVVGPVIALERRSELPPELGAKRLFVADTAWKEVVSAVLPKASAVVYKPGMSASLRWELEECIRILPRNRLIIDCRDSLDATVRECLSVAGIVVRDHLLGSPFIAFDEAASAVALTNFDAVVDHLTR